MRIAVIERPEDVGLFTRQADVITFVYEVADPDHTLNLNKFLYVRTEGELKEKLNLLKVDVSVQDLLRG